MTNQLIWPKCTCMGRKHLQLFNHIVDRKDNAAYLVLLNIVVGVIVLEGSCSSKMFGAYFMTCLSVLYPDSCPM